MHLIVSNHKWQSVDSCSSSGFCGLGATMPTTALHSVTYVRAVRSPMRHRNHHPRSCTMAVPLQCLLLATGFVVYHKNPLAVYLYRITVHHPIIPPSASVPDFALIITFVLSFSSFPLQWTARPMIAHISVF